jgi:tetrahydromethanopterin S-methyltransferase subunit B
VLKFDDVHVHIHTIDTDRVVALLTELTQLGAQLMTKLDDIQAQVTTIRSGVAAIGGSLGNVSADIERIKAQLVGGMTATEADTAIADLTTLQEQVAAVATAAADLAASNPDPAA